MGKLEPIKLVQKDTQEKYSTLIVGVFQQTFFCASPTDSPYDNAVIDHEDDEGGDDNTGDAVVDVDYVDDGE